MESRPSRSLARMTAGKVPSRWTSASSVAISRRSFTSWRIRHLRRELIEGGLAMFDGKLGSTTTDREEEKWRRRAIERFIPKTFTRVDAEDRVNLLDDLEPLIKELEGMVTIEDWKNRESTDPTSKPRRGFRGIVRITSSDEAGSISVVRVWLRIWSYESFKRAEEGFAENVAMINIALQPGSLTGQEVGELTRHYAKNESASIIFLRRNVVASLACRAEIYSVSTKE